MSKKKPPRLLQAALVRCALLALFAGLLLHGMPFGWGLIFGKLFMFTEHQVLQLFHLCLGKSNQNAIAAHSVNFDTGGLVWLQWWSSIANATKRVPGAFACRKRGVLNLQLQLECECEFHVRLECLEQKSFS